MGYFLALIFISFFTVPALAQNNLNLGVSADDLALGYHSPPEVLRYRITSRSLPAPVQVVFHLQERSNGITLTGQGIFETDPETSIALHLMLARQMGTRVQLVDDRVVFPMSSRLDEARRAKEIVMFGISKWFQPNDCFAVIGECASFHQGGLLLGRRLNVKTTETNGIWHAKATVEGSNVLAYSVSYTVDEAGFLIDENRTELVDGVKVRTSVRRIYTE